MAPDGLLIVDKPAGPTSHDVVQRVRKLLNTRRVGHGGTLDPDATGVLLVAAGQATRFFPFLAAGEEGLRGPHPPRFRHGHLRRLRDARPPRRAPPCPRRRRSPGPWPDLRGGHPADSAPFFGQEAGRAPGTTGGPGPARSSLSPLPRHRVPIRPAGIPGAPGRFRGRMFVRDLCPVPCPRPRGPSSAAALTSRRSGGPRSAPTGSRRPSPWPDLEEAAAAGRGRPLCHAPRTAPRPRLRPWTVRPEAESRVRNGSPLEAGHLADPVRPASPRSLSPRGSSACSRSRDVSWPWPVPLRTEPASTPSSSSPT
ncbi:MAG: hypothetical protein M0C28_04340 [Candidatus Moduliflexus flocculans]|nr:hypothetical protein [Candidatus Moduliflexus flocculans]